jgi:hypothetical protein
LTEPALVCAGSDVVSNKKSPVRRGRATSRGEQCKNSCRLKLPLFDCLFERDRVAFDNDHEPHVNRYIVPGDSHLIANRDLGLALFRMSHLQRPDNGIVPSSLHQPKVRIRAEDNPEAPSGGHMKTVRPTTGQLTLWGHSRTLAQTSQLCFRLCEAREHGASPGCCEQPTRRLAGRRFAWIRRICAVARTRGFFRLRAHLPPGAEANRKQGDRFRQLARDRCRKRKTGTRGDAIRRTHWVAFLGWSRAAGRLRNRPEFGSLPEELAVALAPVLAHNTATPDRCWFAIWEGFGGLPDEALRAPTFSAPHREYHLLRGPVDQLAEGAYDFLGQQSPNLCWPEDRSWCLATEIDLDPTYLGCEEACCEEILALSALEALAVNPATGIDFASDVLNPVASRGG